MSQNIDSYTYKYAHLYINKNMYKSRYINTYPRGMKEDSIRQGPPYAGIHSCPEAPSIELQTLGT